MIFVLIFVKFIFTVCFGPDSYLGKSLLHHKYNSVDCAAIGQTLRKLQHFV